MHLLLLEDDTLLGELIRDHLVERGHTVAWFTDGEEAEAALMESGFDMFLLDVGVPGIDGFELLRALRQRHDRTPVIMLTSRNSSRDVKEGFEMGCDDYLKKPFEFDELDARIDHLAKVAGLSGPETIELEEGVEFIPNRHMLVLEGTPFPLTPKTSQLLHYLVRHAGRIVSREELVQNLWGWDEAPTDATIRSYIKTLRKHLSHIVTERGVGYGWLVE
ncbi:response regulator transcription factor [Hydrogenimonas sp.]